MLPAGEVENCKSTCERMLLNFGNWFFENGCPVADYSEEKIFSKKYMMMGIIDAINMGDGKTVIIDYKTSSSDDITADIQRQAIVYYLIFKDKFKKSPDKILIHFLNYRGPPRPVYIDDEVIKWGKILIEGVRMNITSQKEADYPCTCGGYCERNFIGG